LHPYSRRLQIDSVPAHAGRLAHTQAVAVHHQDEEVVADAITAPLSRLEHAIYLGLAQIVLVALVGISSYRSTILIYTLYNMPLGRPHFTPPNHLIYRGVILPTLYKIRKR